MGTLVNGIKEIFATSQSTATHLPVCASDGTPQGRISVGDLASVLGVEKVINLASTDNIDDLSPAAQSTKYWFSGTRPLGTWPSSIPVASNSELFIFRQGSQSRWVQLLYDINTQQAFLRTKSGVTVSDWHEFSLDIPSFYKNYNNVTTLTSAVGGCRTVVLNSDQELTLTVNGHIVLFVSYGTNSASVFLLSVVSFFDLFNTGGSIITATELGGDQWRIQNVTGSAIRISYIIPA